MPTLYYTCQSSRYISQIAVNDSPAHTLPPTYGVPMLAFKHTTDVNDVHSSKQITLISNAVQTNANKDKLIIGPLSVVRRVVFTTGQVES